MEQPALSTFAKMKKAAFTVLGTLFLALGAIGIFVPILPTTPFLLLSAACYFRGSGRMHKWLINNRVFGVYLKNYKEGKGMSRKAKILTLTLLWITIVLSALIIVPMLVIQIALVCVCVGVTIHLIRIPTYRQTVFAINKETADALSRRQTKSSSLLKEASKHNE
jgi:uncharacterized membrane protein YbaN (DUF454 family)